MMFLQERRPGRARPRALLLDSQVQARLHQLQLGARRPYRCQ